MKESKPVKPGWAGRKTHQSQFAQEMPPRAEAAMHTDVPLRKAGGRLSREDQRRLGDILQKVYDDVIRQGVPDRFRDLLNELDDARDRGPAATASPHRPSQPREQVHGQGAGEHNSEPDQVMEAKSSGSPGSKGSH